MPDSEGGILITGAGRGIGRAMAEHYLARGRQVFGCSRSPQALEHPAYRHFSLDITDENAVKEMFFSIRKSGARLNALINNAGIAKMNAFVLTPVENVRQVMDINYTGTYICSRAAVGLLKKSPAPRIVNMTTVAVPLRLEGEAAYAASKSAVETLTRIMARELAAFGITCNAVGPSPVDTDLIKGVGKERIDKLVRRQAIPKMARPEDVINAVEFFLKPESAMVTGQIIYLGGIS